MVSDGSSRNMRVVPLKTDPSSHMMRFDYNRKSYVTANLSGHGDKEIYSDEENMLGADYNSVVPGALP